MSALEEYICERKANALLIEKLLAAASACANGSRHDLLIELIDAAHDAAKALNLALDIINLPEVSAA